MGHPAIRYALIPDSAPRAPMIVGPLAVQGISAQCIPANDTEHALDALTQGQIVIACRRAGLSVSIARAKKLKSGVRRLSAAETEALADHAARQMRLPGVR